MSQLMKTAGSGDAPPPPGEEEPEPGAAGCKRTAAQRVLSLLGAFSRGGGALTLSEISRHADLSLTTAHRLTREVLEWGGLELDPGGRYRLSSKILDLASTSTREMHLRDAAVAHLVNLHRHTGLTVNLSVPDGKNVMYLEALRSHPNYTGESRIGGRLRMHVTATGLVLLAYADETAQEEYASEPLKRYTDQTITSAPELLDYLESVREQGYAVAPGFVSPLAGSVAAPVLDPDGGVRAAVGVVYRTGRHDPGPLVSQVRMAATRISRTLHEGKTNPDPRTVDFNRRHAGLI